MRDVATRASACARSSIAGTRLARCEDGPLSPPRSRSPQSRGVGSPGEIANSVWPTSNTPPFGNPQRGTRAPFTNTPFRESRSSTCQWSCQRMSRAWWRESDLPGSSRWSVTIPSFASRRARRASPRPRMTCSTPSRVKRAPDAVGLSHSSKTWRWATGRAPGEVARG